MDYKGAKGSGSDRVASYGEISAINSMLFNTQTVDYTLVLTDANSGVSINSATAKNLTIPPNSSVAFGVGTQIVVRQQGAGGVTIVAGEGVTINGATTATGAQWATIVLIKEATDTWFVVTGQKGDTGATDTTTTLGALINGATAKTTPVDADMVGLMDSAASNILKKLSWANIKATLKAYFDTLYQAAVWTTIIKMTDEARTSSTLLDDATLKFTTVANTKYTIRIRVFMLTNTTADSKYRMAHTGTTTRVQRAIYRTATSDTPAAQAALAAFDAADVQLTTTGTMPYVEEDIVLSVGASGGVFSFQWAQNTTNAGACTVFEGSYLEYATS
jgi:hypothetical protein